MESRKNGELIKKKKAKTEKSFKITKVRNPLGTLPPFTYFVYWVTSGSKRFLVSLTSPYRNSRVSFVGGSETCMPSTGEDEPVNSLPLCSGTRTGFKYEWAHLPQLTEVPTHSTAAAEMLPPAPGSHFSEQQFRKCIFITFKRPNELKHKTLELQRKRQTPVGRASIRCICIVLWAPLSGSIPLRGRRSESPTFVL